MWGLVAGYALTLVGIGILIGLGLSKMATEGIEPEGSAPPLFHSGGPEPLHRDGDE